MSNTTTPSVTQTELKYNPQTDQYFTVNGKVKSFSTKEEAVLDALDHDFPGLIEAFDDVVAIHSGHLQSEKLHSRLMKAAQLIVNGKVYRNRVQGTISSPYITKEDGLPKSWRCNCPDFRRDNGGVQTDYGKMCKHTLAQLLAKFAGLDLPEYVEELPEKPKKEFWQKADPMNLNNAYYRSNWANNPNGYA